MITKMKVLSITRPDDIVEFLSTLKPEQIYGICYFSTWCHIYYRS